MKWSVWWTTTIASFVGLLVVSSDWKHKGLEAPLLWRGKRKSVRATLSTTHRESFEASTGKRALLSPTSTLNPGEPDSPLFAPNSKLKTGLNEYTITTPDGLTRMYYAYIPRGLVEPPALVLDYHAIWDTADGQYRSSEFDGFASEKNVILVFPNSVGRFFNSFNAGTFSGPVYEVRDVDDIAFTKALIEEIKQNLIINPRRIYATGYSSGGAMAIYAGYKLPEYIAALSSGGWTLNEDTYQEVLEARASNKNWHPMPVLLINGYNDPVFCWDSCLTPWQIIDWQRNGSYSDGKNGWRRWADVNRCTGNAVTLAKNPGERGDNDAHSDLWWDRTYRRCAGGVEVRQILNSNNHAGEIFIPGASGFEAQPLYAERILDFFLLWTLPETIEVTVPEWWSARGV